MSTNIRNVLSILMVWFLVFQCLHLKEEELSVREVDFIDIVNDPIDESKYKEEEVGVSEVFDNATQVRPCSVSSVLPVKSN